MDKKLNKDGLWVTESQPMGEEDLKRLQRAMWPYSKRKFPPQYEVLSPEEYDWRVEQYKKMEARSEGKV